MSTTGSSNDPKGTQPDEEEASATATPEPETPSTDPNPASPDKRTWQ